MLITTKGEVMATPQDCLKILLSTLNNSSNTIVLRTAAAEGLGTIGGEEARKALIAILSNSSNTADLRAAAAKAVGHAANH